MVKHPSVVRVTQCFTFAKEIFYKIHVFKTSTILVFQTALHIAAENGELDIARLLLEYDADLLAKDSSGLTAMDLAEKAEQPHVMELLKEAASK